MAGRPVKYNKPEEMQRIVDLYFIACRVHREGDLDLLEGLSSKDLLVVNDVRDDHPTVTGLGLALDLTRQGLIEYGEKTEFSDTVKKAKARVENYLEQRLYSNNPTGCIFNLKNNFGWRDQRELTGDGGGPVTVQIVRFADDTASE